MKKIILLAAVAAFHYANAQSAPSAYAVNAKTVRQNAYDYFEKFGSSDVSVNSKALKTFSKSYAAATDAQWSVFDDNSSTCRFYVKGILHRAYYTSNGLWKGTLITYHEELLPENIREMVANDLPEYNITLVNEVDRPHAEPIFVIEAQSMKFIKRLRVTTETGIEIMNEFVKQN